jgi:4-hydroxy-tetrahydrodipicolinate synthase
MEKLLRGCGTALATPFRDGAVDYDAYRNLVGRQAEAGIHFLVPLGSTAETPCLSDDEKVRLLQITREEFPGKPIVAGAGSNSLDATLRTIKLLEPCNPDAFLIVVPFYNKPTQEGIYEYFKAVAAATSKPIVMYNVPGRTGTNMKASTALRLAHDVSNIIAVKEASGNLNQIEHIIAGAPEGFSVLSGNDDQTFPIMACGGDGIVSVASNAAPEQMAAFVNAALAGDWDKAREWNYKLLDLFDNCFVESNPIPVKAGMAALGLCTAEMRLPLTEATAQTKEIMKATLDALNVKS